MAEMAAAAWAFVKAAFVAVGSGTATAGQVATVVAVNVAGSVALSTAASVLMKPDVGGRAPGEWLADPNAGIPFAIGDRIGVAGNIVYKNTFGKDNEYKGIVTVLSGAGPISAYLGFTADREPVTFAGEAATGRYGGEMWMQRRLGEQPDTALTSPAAITYQKLPDWGPNHRLSGKAAFMWTLRMDSKFSVYPQGEPAPITVLRGIKGYDHRYDSTMPGGSGPCRLNDRATYRTITNPAIADLNWCLGLRENGKVVGGLGVSPAGIDWSAYTRAANVADANAWTLAAYPRSDESKSEVRAGMLQAAGAVISRRAGLVSCVTRGAPKSPVMTISAADTAGPIELDTAANVLNRYNTMTPRYLSEAHEWQLAPSAPVSSSVYVEEDRGRVRSDQRDYPYVPNAKQAAELCALDIAHSREGIAGRWPLKAYCRELEPGDVFTVDEPGLLLDGMDMLVLDRDYDPETDTPYVVFVSETPGKVAWALGQQANPSPTPALSARHDLNAPDPGAFDVVIVTPSPEGVSAPGAEVVIDIDNARAEDLVIEIGPSFDGPWRVAKTVTINDGQLRIPVNELSPGEVFWVALSYRSADDGASPKTIKGPYTAGDLIAGDVTHLKGEPVQDILDKLSDTATLAEETSDEVQSIRDMYGDTANAATSAAAAAIDRAAAEAAAALSEGKAQDSAASAVAAGTSAGNALGSANASAASASVASTKADEASVSAAASTAAKTAAETARGQAQTAATQASSSRDDAAGSAASASASATQAANSRDAAAGSATAAAGSASTANTKATEAGNSASAAQASQVAANAAKDAAQSSASAASTSASNAAASATTAGEKATAASGSANTAATRAGEALTYRNQAASSASDAAGVGCDGIECVGHGCGGQERRPGGGGHGHVSVIKRKRVGGFCTTQREHRRAGRRGRRLSQKPCVDRLDLWSLAPRRGNLGRSDDGPQHRIRPLWRMS
nr:phage tail protein [Enterobacter roggenkampii]